MMSERCCKSQIPGSNTVGGVAETRTVLQSTIDVQIDVCMYRQVQNYKPLPSSWRGHEELVGAVNIGTTFFMHIVVHSFNVNSNQFVCSS